MATLKTGENKLSRKDAITIAETMKVAKETLTFASQNDHFIEYWEDGLYEVETYEEAKRSIQESIDEVENYLVRTLEILNSIYIQKSTLAKFKKLSEFIITITSGIEIIYNIKVV